MTDGRRDRYRVAIARDTFGRPNDDAVVCAAEAAMAVADAERESDRMTIEEDTRSIDRLNEENARLRAEIRSANAQRWGLASRVDELNEENFQYI